LPTPRIAHEGAATHIDITKKNYGNGVLCPSAQQNENKRYYFLLGIDFLGVQIEG